MILDIRYETVKDVPMKSWYDTYTGVVGVTTHYCPDAQKLTIEEHKKIVASCVVPDDRMNNGVEMTIKNLHKNGYMFDDMLPGEEVEDDYLFVMNTILGKGYVRLYDHLVIK